MQSSESETPKQDSTEEPLWDESAEPAVEEGADSKAAAQDETDNAAEDAADDVSGSETDDAPGGETDDTMGDLAGSASSDVPGDAVDDLADDVAEGATDDTAEDAAQDATDDTAEDATSDATSDTADDAADDALRKHTKRLRLVRRIAIALVVVVVLLASAGIGAYGIGLIVPASAAAKYGTFDYLDESEVTDYIMTYKEQMGYGDATDTEWATFLATYNLTPERLRLSTIAQLLSNRAIEKRCAELGITVSDEEIDATITTLRNMMGALDDDVWSETLDLYGQTEEGLREVYRLALLQEKLCTAEVELPTPTEDEVRSYIESFAATRQASEAAEAATTEEAQEILTNGTGTLLRHSYCFTFKTENDEVTLDESSQVELIRQEFLESGTDVETFVTLLALYSNDSDAIENNGSMGWDADTSEYSEMYARMLAEVEVGGVSSVFTDGDTVCFIWVDQGYTIPYSSDELAALDLSAMPTSLYEYFSDCEAYLLWDEASDEYLSDLIANMDVTIYEMPSDVPYNVDMSDYLVTDSDDSSTTYDAIIEEDEADETEDDDETDASD